MADPTGGCGSSRGLSVMPEVVGYASILPKWQSGRSHMHPEGEISRTIGDTRRMEGAYGNDLYCPDSGSYRPVDRNI
jgi:hypothetical protein